MSDNKATRRTIATEADLQRVLNLHQTLGGSATAKRLKIPVGTISGMIVRAKRLGLKPGQIPQEDARAKELTGLRDKVAELDATIRAMHRDELTDENVSRIIMGARDAAVRVEPPEWIERPSKSGKGLAGVPSAMWSDFHWGEVVDPAQVNGINEYNLATARARFRHTVRKTVSLCKNYMVGADYPGIVINLGGDMISGDIHEELVETNEIPTIPVVLDLLGELISAIKILKAEFGRVFIPCVRGNHGRNTHRPRFKNPAYTSFDWLLYKFLQLHFAEDPAVTFHIPVGADAPYQVYGHRYLLTHGDFLGVKGGDGIIGSLGPILRGEFKIRNSQSAMGQGYDTLIMGHWHQYLPLKRVIVNGSLIGYNEFAKLALRATPEPPMQALWFTHPDYGVTAHWNVLADPVRRGASVGAQAEWTSWPKDK